MPGILLGALAIALAYATAFFPAATQLSPWLMVGGVTLLLCSLIVRGARRHGRLPKALVLCVGFLAVVLLGGFGAALALPAEAPGLALWLGLPRRAALLVYGIGLLPVLVLPLVYALTFETTVLREADLTELRARLAELREKAGPA